MSMKNKKKLFLTIVMLVLAGLWCALIYTLSDMNTKTSNGHSKEIISVFIEDSIETSNNWGLTNLNPSIEKIDKASKILNLPLRKLMHASVYFVLSIVLIFYINYMFDIRKFFLSAFITIALCAGFAASDEYHQTFVEGRTGQVADVLIDTAGACVGTILYGTYYISFRLGYRRCEVELLDEQELEKTKVLDLKKVKKKAKNK